MDFKISIIIPVYNTENYLKTCIDSILNQTYKNIELILVNDGSNDSSGNICDAYEKEDSRIKVIHQNNKGQSAARNVGLKHAKGDYITFVDSDDWIELNMYEIMLTYMHKYKLDIIECDIHYTSDEIRNSNPEFIIENKEQAALRIIENRFFSVCRRIYKYQIIKNLRFDENYIYEDMLFTSELLCKINKIGYYNMPFYHYFIENTQSTMHSVYNIKNLKSIDVISYFEKNIKNCFKNEQIINASKNYILMFSVNHYIKLFQYQHFDKNFIYRKKLKSIIKSNYDEHSKKNGTLTKIARYSPMWFFKLFLSLNKKTIPKT